MLIYECESRSEEREGFDGMDPRRVIWIAIALGLA